MKQQKLNFAKAKTKKPSTSSSNITPERGSQVVSDGVTPVTSEGGSQVDTGIVDVHDEPVASQSSADTQNPHDQLVPGIPPVDDILNQYDEWKIKLPENLNSLHARTKRSWLAGYSPDWKSSFPWIETVIVDNQVVGVLCSLCRSKPALEDSMFRYVQEKSKGKFVTLPFVRFGNFLDAAKAHEFGNKPVPKYGVRKYRAQIQHGTVDIPQTLHMRVYLNAMARYAATGNDIRQQVVVSNQNLTIHEQALSMFISQLHSIIKRRDSPFSNMKDIVLFNISILQCKQLSCFLRGNKGVSHRLIKDIITAIYYLTLLGIYCEMAAHLRPGEPIIFGGMIDLGSKLKKTKEYAGVAIKIISSNYLVSRVIGFIRCATKDGYTLMQKLIKCFETFNDTIKFILLKIGDDRFPVKVRPLPLLQIENMNSLGIDGACISKNKMINRRVLQYNPRCIVNWCGDHRASLVAGDALKGDKRHNEAHDVSLKLYDLVNASARFSEQFKTCQENTGEFVQFKSGKAVELGDRPMNRWESSLKFNSKLLKLLRSVESFMAVIIQRKWATNAKNSHTYAVHWLSKHFTKPKYLVTMATETDILEVLVTFIKETEYTNTDVVHYQECVNEVSFELAELLLTPGPNYLMIENALSGCLSEWAGDETKEQWRAMRKESVEIYHHHWNDRYNGEDNQHLQMSGFFSMREFRTYVNKLQQPMYRCSSNTVEKVTEFGKIYETKLIDFYLKTKTFVAEYPEAQGREFSAAPISDEKTLRKQFRKFKLVLYHSYLENNPATGEPWETCDTLTNLLYRSLTDVSIQCWLYCGSPLHHIIKCYLCQITETAEVERLMSVFCLQESKLNQGSTPEYLERMVIIQKESPSWDLFDSYTAGRMWRCLPDHAGDRRILSLPPLSDDIFSESPGKLWLKSISLIKEAHLKRKKLWERKYKSRDESLDTLGDIEPSDINSDESGSELLNSSDDENDETHHPSNSEEATGSIDMDMDQNDSLEEDVDEASDMPTLPKMAKLSEDDDELFNVEVLGFSRSSNKKIFSRHNIKPVSSSTVNYGGGSDVSVVNASWKTTNSNRGGNYENEDRKVASGKRQDEKMKASSVEEDRGNEWDEEAFQKECNNQEKVGREDSEGDDENRDEEINKIRGNMLGISTMSDDDEERLAVKHVHSEGDESGKEINRETLKTKRK